MLLLTVIELLLYKDAFIPSENPYITIDKSCNFTTFKGFYSKFNLSFSINFSSTSSIISSVYSLDISMISLSDF